MDYTDEAALYSSGHVAVRHIERTIAQFRKIEIKEFLPEKKVLAVPSPASQRERSAALHLILYSADNGVEGRRSA